MPRTGYKFGAKKRGAKPRGRNAAVFKEALISQRKRDGVDMNVDSSSMLGATPTANTDIEDKNNMAPTKKRIAQLKRARAARFRPKVAEPADTIKNSTVDTDISDHSTEPQACGEAKQRLATFNTSATSTPGESYFLIHESFMRSLLSEVACTDCGNSELELSTTNSSGLAAQLKIYCSRCANEWEGWTSPSVNKNYDINHRAVLGCKDTGIDFLQLKSVLSSMNIKPQMHPSTFYTISKTVGMEAQETAEDAMCKTSSVAPGGAAPEGLQL